MDTNPPLEAFFLDDPDLAEAVNRARAERVRQENEGARRADAERKNPQPDPSHDRTTFGGRLEPGR